MKRMLLHAAALLAALALAGCSLLKVAVSTGDPLPREAMNLRVTTRGFSYDLSSEVAAAADAFAASAPDLPARIRAVRWKIRATRAAVTAAMQGIPEVALADLWILCRRMDEGFAALPDSLLFGPSSDVARTVAARLDRRAERLAREGLSAERYALLADFVGAYLREHPVRDEGTEAANTTLAWMEYLRARGIEDRYATGSIAEVIADVNDRLSGQTQQLSNSIGWSKELLEMQLHADSTAVRLGAQLDSLDRRFERLALVAERLPELSSAMVEGLGGELAQLLAALDRTVHGTFADVSREREAMQRYVTGEREALVAQLRTTAEELVRQSFEAVPGLVGRLLLYVVLAIGVLVGVPFALGFVLGRKLRR